jgi:hypothetical protein
MGRALNLSIHFPRVNTPPPENGGVLRKRLAFDSKCDELASSGAPTPGHAECTIRPNAGLRLMVRVQGNRPVSHLL